MTDKKLALLQRFKETTNKVYGDYVAGGVWRPKAYLDNKSRYLWTDAYGVVNYLTLYVETKEKHFLEQAETLVACVHDILGKTRDGKRRLDGASDEHPTGGGLRYLCLMINLRTLTLARFFEMDKRVVRTVRAVCTDGRVKVRNVFVYVVLKIGKPKDEGSGMEQDGQYYHYLTKWMFALNRMTIVTGKPFYNAWAMELAKTAHKSFVKDGRMFWKMSIDLQKPLTSSEGGLDSYDGLTMYKILQSTGGGPSLTHEIGEMQAMVNHRADRYQTNDALDAGEALWLAHFFPDETYSKRLYERASKCVDNLWKSGEFADHAHRRLAFREFGTTIGVQMHPTLAGVWTERVDKMHEFWAGNLYSRDCDITPVMYCTSLIPTVFRAQFAA